MSTHQIDQHTGYGSLGRITPDYSYSLRLTLEEGYVLIEHRVPATDDNIIGNTMRRTQATAGPAVELAFSRYIRAYDDNLITGAILRGFAAGAARAITGGYIGDYCFDKLIELESLQDLIRSHRREIGWN